MNECAIFLKSFNNIDRSGSPIPIEYLPAENTLSSKVRLMILYQNRPTTTIAVGDPLTLRIEAQDGYNQLTDIFATNVVARDPYSGRSIQLIDRYGYGIHNNHSSFSTKNLNQKQTPHLFFH